MTYDAFILGGGPAGLAAALTLGRARKSVLVVDGGNPRNASAKRMHNFPTQDGTPPQDFRAQVHRELEAYPKVQRATGLVERAEALPQGAWRLAGSFGEAVEAKHLLLASGMVDQLPPWPGLKEVWGDQAFICPFCHGWEAQDQAWLLVVGDAQKLPFARMLQGWTSKLSLLLEKGLALPEGEAEALAEAGIPVHQGEVAEVLLEAGRLKGLRLLDGRHLPTEQLVLHPPQKQTALVQSLALPLDPLGFVVANEMGGVVDRPGLWAAGDLITPGQSALLAAAAGMRAAAGITHSLNAGGGKHPG